MLLLTMFVMLPVALTLLKERPSAAARVAELSVAKNDRSPAALPKPGIKPTRPSILHPSGLRKIRSGVSAGVGYGVRCSLLEEQVEMPRRDDELRGTSMRSKLKLVLVSLSAKRGPRSSYSVSLASVMPRIL